MTRARLNDPRLQHRLRRPGGLLAVYRQRVDDAHVRVADAVRRTRRRRNASLDSIGRRLARRSPSRLIGRRRLRATAAARKARAAIGSRRQDRDGSLAAVAARVEALSPLSVLARGYSICERRRDGVILRRATEVDPGDQVSVRLSEGRLDCRVERTGEDPRLPVELPADTRD